MLFDGWTESNKYKDYYPEYFYPYGYSLTIIKSDLCYNYYEEI